MKRTRGLALLLAAVVAAGTAGWIGGRQVKSPAQIAAESEPPAASRITVPVEMRTLSSSIVTRGTVRFDTPVTITLRDPPALVTGLSIATGVPEAGTVLNDGDRAIEVSNRPVFVLEGDLPMFRTIRPGDQGEDVQQLEQALSRLGFDPGPLDGTFDQATGVAVQAWYRSRGYEPLGPGEEQLGELDAAEDAVRVAADELAAAEVALARAGARPPDWQVLEMEGAVRAAEWAVTDANLWRARDNDDAADEVADGKRAVRRAADAKALADERLLAAETGIHPDTGLPPTEQELEQLAGEAAEAAGVAAAAQATMGEASAAKTIADQRLAAAQGGTHPDTGLPPTPEQLAELEAEAALAATVLAGAEQAFHEAEAEKLLAEERLAAARIGIHPDTGLAPTPQELRQLAEEVANAAEWLDEVKDLLGNARDARSEIRTQGDRNIVVAEDGLTIARAHYDELMADPDVSTEQSVLEAARTRLAETQTELQILQNELGINAVHSEILFVKNLPARIDTVSVARGDEIPPKVMQLTSSRLLVDSYVSVNDVRRVEVGDRVLIDDQFTGIETSGTIVTIADAPESGRVGIEIVPHEHVEQLAGINVRITIPLETTGGDVLVVPHAALSAAADGSARVEVELEDGSTRLVPVITGLQASGHVEVAPVLEGTLHEGDRVVVGFDYGGRS